MNLLKKIIDLILYGNFWIACCALAFYAQTVFLIGKDFEWTALAGLVFFSSFFLYAVHRIFGIHQLSKYIDVDRYHVIAHFSHHIKLYAIVTGIAALYYFFKISSVLQLSLIIPGIISLSYVMPILGNKKRLRDLAYIKIFLIAIVWSWVTVALPAIEYNSWENISVYLMGIERALFVFAITLPFDIRDLKVDEFSKVPTLPYKIGIRNTKILGYCCLAIAGILIFVNYQIGFYTLSTLSGLGLSLLTTNWMLWYSKPETHDYFYSGLLDGSMLLQFLFIYSLSYN